ncbi:MAG: lysine exporter LysO family protein [Spirochaetaceae bacterium]
METLTGLLVIFGFLAAGMIAERLRLVPRYGSFSFVMNSALALLLFSMGLRIGLMESVTSRLLQIGFLSIGFAAATVAGTAFAIAVVLAVTGRLHVLMDRRRSAGISVGSAAVYLEPLRLFACVAAGFLGGYFLPIFGWFREDFTSWLLYLLLFLIGIQLVRDEIDLKKTVLHPATFFVPAAAVVGSLAGGLAVAGFFGVSPGKAMALASGFGWYSLSGVLITDMGSPVLGAAGFLINLIREIIALLLLPLFGRLHLPHIAIGVAGATSMDVTLPLVERSCGGEYVPLSIANGAVLSLLVPFLVPLFYHLG